MKSLEKKLGTILYQSSFIHLFFKISLTFCFDISLEASETFKEKVENKNLKKIKYHNKIIKKTRRAKSLERSDIFLHQLKEGTLSPIYVPKINFFVANYSSFNTGLFLEEKILKQLKNNNGVLILQFLSSKEFGEEISTMNNALAQHLHRTDYKFSKCKYGETSPGTVYSLVKKCLEQKIPIIPLEYKKTKEKELTKEEQRTRKNLLLWRAHSLAKKYKSKYQVWVVQNSDLYPTKNNPGALGIRNIVRGGTTRGVF